jgi:uncharacterized membrane protein
MQIIIGIAIFIIVITIILYKVNKQFEKREFIILILIIVITLVAYTLYENKQEEFLPNMFKEKYEKEKSIQIKELTFELINNKIVSSKTKFIYKFTYIISKDNKEFLCTVTDVEINKIEDSYIFRNFKDLKEECTQR